jgi:hypothetical protein
MRCQQRAATQDQMYFLNNIPQESAGRMEIIFLQMLTATIIYTLLNGLHS